MESSEEVSCKDLERVVKEVLGSQSVAKQCMVAAILHKPEVAPLAFAEKLL